VSFDQPLMLLTLLVVPILAGLYLLMQRRRARYAVAFTNMDVLAAAVGRSRPWRRWLAASVFLLALAALCVATARPQVSKLVPSQQATVILVVDVSGSMQATDVRPSRLGAAQHAVKVFLDHAPKQLRVALIAFAGEVVVGAPPTTDHGLVRQADDSLDQLLDFRGTAIGDALAAAVQLGQQAVGPTKSSSVFASCAFVNFPPVVAAIACSVAGSGGTGIEPLKPPNPPGPGPPYGPPPSLLRSRTPPGVPSATVYTGIPAAFACAEP